MLYKTRIYKKRINPSVNLHNIDRNKSVKFTRKCYSWRFLTQCIKLILRKQPLNICIAIEIYTDTHRLIAIK